MRVTQESVGTGASRVRSMPVEGAASGDRQDKRVMPSWLVKGLRGLRTASLYVLVCVVSFVGVVVLFSVAESLWLRR